jgi:hypothetical protein
MSNLGVRALHLHTVDSLCGDLISGRPVGVGPENEEFSLSEPARAALDWYRRNPRKWTANVSQTDANALVDATAVAPPVLPGVAGRMAGAPARRLTLKRLTAHRFAGLHTFGLPSEAPPNFTFEFQSLLTLFEGLNGSGKTCLVNAIAWTLTGECSAHSARQKLVQSNSTAFWARLTAQAHLHAIDFLALPLCPNQRCIFRQTITSPQTLGSSWSL